MSIPSVFFVFFLTLSLLNFPQKLWAVPQKTSINLNSSDGQVEFFAVGNPSLLRVHGKGQGPQGHFEIIDQKVTGEGSFDLSSLDTGIDMRNQHMKEKYLEIQKYPSATLKITQMILPQTKDAKDWSQDKVPFEGTLFLHGEEKKVSGISKVSRHDKKIKLECDFSIKLKDFGITVPSYAGITIANDVKVHVSEGVPVVEN